MEHEEAIAAFHALLSQLREKMAVVDERALADFRKRVVDNLEETVNNGTFQGRPDVEACLVVEAPRVNTATRHRALDFLLELARSVYIGGNVRRTIDVDDFPCRPVSATPGAYAMQIFPFVLLQVSRGQNRQPVTAPQRLVVGHAKTTATATLTSTLMTMIL